MTYSSSLHVGKALEDLHDQWAGLYSKKHGPFPLSFTPADQQEMSRLNEAIKAAQQARS
jgi:hypothetical protein